MIIRTKKTAQQNAQSITELIAYLVSMEKKIEPAPTKAEQFRLLFDFLHLYLQDAIMQKETMVTGNTQLEETTFLFESTVTPPQEITMRKPGIARCCEALKQKNSPSQLYAVKALLV